MISSKLPAFVVLFLLIASTPLLSKRAAASEIEPHGSTEEHIFELIDETVREYERTAGVYETLNLRRASARERKIARVLKKEKISLEIVDQGVKSTLGLLREITGLNIVVSGKACKALKVDDPKVSITLRDLPVENVLNLIALHLGDYRFVVRYGALQLVTRDEYRVRLKLRVYNIRDVLYAPPDFPAPKLGLEDTQQRDA